MARPASPAHLIAVAVARRLRRPTPWTETRSEAQLSMHGRGQVQFAELGLRRDGTITGLRVRAIGDAGAYAGFGGALVGGSTRMMAHGVYRIPRLAFDSVAVLTNTTPMGAFRGAGRPEAAAMLERMIDLAADELDLDPVEIRRHNFIQPDAFPYETTTGATYDVGDFDLPLREVLRIGEYDALVAEQRRRRDEVDPVQLGIGLATYVEVTGGGSGEFGAVDIDADGVVTIRVGTSAHGQGHATTFAMVVADKLGVPMERVRFVQSDTAAVPRGQGTGGSRSLQLGGSALGAAADLVVDQARDLAARLLEAPASDVELAEDGFQVVGVPTATVSWLEIAKLASEEETRLGADHDFKAEGATFPFGAQLAVVEVDTETGFVRPVRLVAVDDCGRIVNPLIVAGQQHGGAAQGVSQALWEKFEYDEDGQPVTATFVDYTLPTAADMPDLVVTNTETPSPLNPLGAKGIGESATIGSTPAMQNAVVDALSHLGVKHVVVAVDGLDLTIDRGSVTAVLGPNGAGKTTTVETCEGYRGPQSGGVRVLGLDPRRHRRCGARVGVMLQNGGVWSGARPARCSVTWRRCTQHPLDVDGLIERLGLAGCGRRRTDGCPAASSSGSASRWPCRPESARPGVRQQPTAGLDPQHGTSPGTLCASCGPPVSPSS